jgi:hypothetical protein
MAFNSSRSISLLVAQESRVESEFRAKNGKAKAHGLLYPEGEQDRCTGTVLIEVDREGLVRGSIREIKRHTAVIWTSVQSRLPCFLAAASIGAYQHARIRIRELI